MSCKKKTYFLVKNISFKIVFFDLLLLRLAEDDKWSKRPQNEFVHWNSDLTTFSDGRHDGLEIYFFESRLSFIYFPISRQLTFRVS